MKSPEQGAATSDLPRLVARGRGRHRPVLRQPQAQAVRQGVATTTRPRRRLWQVSADLVGLDGTRPQQLGTRRGSAHEARRTPGQLRRCPAGPRRSARRSPASDGPPRTPGVDNLSLMDHYLQLEMAGGAGRADAGGLHDPRLPRRAHQHRRAAAAGHRRHLPAPGPARQDRVHPRRALRRPGRARHRRGLVRARARRRSACRSRRWPSGSSGSRRRCRSSARCGATTTARSTAGTTGWPRRINSPQPLSRPPADHDRRAAGRRRRCGWSRGTPTPATCSPAARGRARARSTRSSTSCAGTARARAPTSTRIRKTILWTGPLDADADGGAAFAEADGRLTPTSASTRCT